MSSSGDPNHRPAPPAPPAPSEPPEPGGSACGAADAPASGNLGASPAELALLRRRDPAAFGRLVDQCQPLVLGLCQSRGLSGADLDDAAAEAFAEVWLALPTFEARSAPATWVYRIAARKIAKLRARRAVGRPPQEAAAADVSSAPAAGPTPLESLEAADEAEGRRRVWDAVAALEPREAMAVEMHYRRSCSVEEIAEVLQCPANTVKTLLFRARQRLRPVLAGLAPGREK